MKKQIPIAMLQIIQPLIELAVKEGLAKQIDDNNKLAHFVDADEYDVSDFHFHIDKPTPHNKFRIQYKPLSTENNNPNSHEVEIKNIEPYLRNWLAILRQYKNLKTVFDNPDRHREKQFYQEAKLIDEDAEYASFGYDKLMLLDQYFEDVSNHILELLPHTSDDKKGIAEELITDISVLREEMPTMPKNEVIKKLSKIFAKSTKAGMRFLKAIYGKFKDKVIDKISETSVEMLSDKANDIIESVSQAL